MIWRTTSTSSTSTRRVHAGELAPRARSTGREQPPRPSAGRPPVREPRRRADALRHAVQRARAVLRRGTTPVLLRPRDASRGRSPPTSWPRGSPSSTARAASARAPLLRAGVARPARARAREHRRARRGPEFAVVVVPALARRSRSLGSLDAIRTRSSELGPASSLRRIRRPALADTLAAWTSALGGDAPRRPRPVRGVLPLPRRRGRGRHASPPSSRARVNEPELRAQLPDLDPRGRAREARPLQGRDPDSSSTTTCASSTSTARPREPRSCEPIEEVQRRGCRRGSRSRSSPSSSTRCSTRCTTGRVRLGDGRGLADASMRRRRGGARRDAVSAARDDAALEERPRTGSSVLRLADARAARGRRDDRRGRISTTAMARCATASATLAAGRVPATSSRPSGRRSRITAADLAD